MKRFTPSMVISLLALIVALSGTAGAAFTLGVNTVGTNQLKNGSVRLVDIAPATVRMLKGQTGSQGAVGPAGAPGAPGAIGPAGPGFNTITEVAGTPISLGGGGQVATLTASCPAGSKAVGVGGYWNIATVAAMKLFGGTATVIVGNLSSLTVTGIYASAFCAS